MEMETVEYKGTEYQTRYVEVPGWGDERIGTESLERALCPDGEWSAVSEAARAIDESIFYYAPDDMIDSPDLGDYVSWMID